MDQLSFSDVEFANKKRTTRREKFLQQMDGLVPWAKLEALIEPHLRIPAKLNCVFRPNVNTVQANALTSRLFTAGVHLQSTGPPSSTA